jgi:hypothetical protein
MILADAHVHIYGCFSLAKFLESAFENFQRQAQASAACGNFDALLFLTETAADNWFHVLRNQRTARPSTRVADPPTWVFTVTREDCSLRAQGPDGQRLVLIAGRQVVTAERLEVLALCTSDFFSDGPTLSQVMNSVRSANGIPVIPWGAGKWVGKRGEILTEFLQEQKPGDIFLGDNSGRPIFWRNPHHFKLAQAKGIRILPGSDPLPFPSECKRAGSFGFAIDGTLGWDRPAADIKDMLLDPSISITPYGSLERPYRFLRNQISMQVGKRLIRTSA